MYNCAHTSGGMGIRNPIFGYLESAAKWVEGKFNKAFHQFLPNFCHYLMIYHSFTVSSTRSPSNMEQNLVKIEEKPCLTCLKVNC